MASVYHAHHDAHNGRRRKATAWCCIRQIQSDILTVQATYVC